MERKEILKKIEQKFDFFAPMYNGIEHFTLEYFLQCATCGGTVIRNGALYLDDREREYVIIRDGIRRTVGQPDSYKNSLYVFGASYAYGSFVEDAHTVPSFLQDLCNSNNYSYKVVNYGTIGESNANISLKLFSINDFHDGDIVVWLHNSGHLFQKTLVSLWQFWYAELRNINVSFYAALLPNCIRTINRSDLERKLYGIETRDIIFDEKLNTAVQENAYISDPHLPALMACGVPCIDLQPFFNRPHSLGEVFIDSAHLNHIGNKAAASVIFDRILKNEIPVFSYCDAHQQSIDYIKDVCIRKYTSNTTITSWIDDILESLPPNPDEENTIRGTGPSKAAFKSQRIGSIVMNCNPFTKGHLSLIEAALDDVDYIYLFIVENDASLIPFQHRISLVKKGLAHYGRRVRIYPSGDFIISSITFPQYFTKEEENIPVDSSLDVIIFGAIIAPALHISKRFVGEEPLCNVTNSYNERLSKTLPFMGVEVEIIPRKLLNGIPISASLVRRYIAEQQYDDARALLPEETTDETIEICKNFLT